MKVKASRLLKPKRVKDLPGFSAVSTVFDVVVIEDSELPPDMRCGHRTNDMGDDLDQPKPKKGEPELMTSNYREVINHIEGFRSSTRKEFTLMMQCRILGDDVQLVKRVDSNKPKEAVDPDENTEDIDIVVEDVDAPGDSHGMDKGVVPESAEKDEDGTKKKPVAQEYFYIKASKERVTEVRKMFAREGMRLDPEYKGAMKLYGYEMRSFVLREFCKTWMSHLWDHVRTTAFSAFATVNARTMMSRSAMIEAFRSDMGEFRRVGLPVLLCKDFKHVRFQNIPKIGMVISAHWDKLLGWVHFRVIRRQRKADKEESGGGKKRRRATLEAWRYEVWRKIVSGEWPARTIHIREHKGRIKIDVPYWRKNPPKAETMDGRTFNIEYVFSDLDNHMQCYATAEKDGVTLPAGMGRDDDLRSRSISVRPAVDQLRCKDAQRKKLKAQLAGCGNKWARTHGFGHRGAFDSISEKLQRLTMSREEAMKTWNHKWTKDLVRRCVEWKCSKMVLHDCPGDVDAAEHKAAKNKNMHDRFRGLGGHFEWGWFNFKFQLKSKCERYGIKYEEVMSPPKSEIQRLGAAAS